MKDRSQPAPLDDPPLKYDGDGAIPDSLAGILKINLSLSSKDDLEHPTESEIGGREGNNDK
jgi:hypothetical protein